MATVGISEAARLAGVSRQHIYKLVEKGEISVIKELTPGKSGDDPKDYRQFVDVSELQRVFPNLSTGGSQVDKKSSQAITPVDSHVDSDFARIEAELLMAKQLLRERDEQLREAREWAQFAKKQAEDVTRLIGYSKPAEAENMVPREKFEELLAEKEKMVPAEDFEQTVKVGRKQLTTLENKLKALENRGFFARLFNKK